MAEQSVSVAVRVRPLTAKEGARLAWRRVPNTAGQIQQYDDADAPVAKAVYAFGASAVATGASGAAATTIAREARGVAPPEPSIRARTDPVLPSRRPRLRHGRVHAHRVRHRRQGSRAVGAVGLQQHDFRVRPDGIGEDAHDAGCVVISVDPAATRSLVVEGRAPRVTRVRIHHRAHLCHSDLAHVPRREQAPSRRRA